MATGRSRGGTRCHLRWPSASRNLRSVSPQRGHAEQPAVSGYPENSRRPRPVGQIGAAGGDRCSLSLTAGHRRCFHYRVDLQLQSLTETIEQADYRVRSGSHAAERIWPTGFDVLDSHLQGGFRSGDLILLGGPQGMGKTTFVLQVARNIARQGRPVLYFCYEHDQTTMLIRLVALEAGLIGGPDAPSLNVVRRIFESSDGLGRSLRERLAETSGGAQALDIVQEYADRLTVHRSSGTQTTLDDIKDTIASVKKAHGAAPFICVDYLQKIPMKGSPNEEERITSVVEQVKDMTLDYDVPVLCVVASDKEGIASGKRMRVNHMRGSSALAYEADTVLMLNNKYDVVARHHLVYDSGNIERFRHWAVLSIEKNRSGVTGVDMEFPKRFEQSRFETHGQLVREKLVDERVFVE